MIFMIFKRKFENNFFAFHYFAAHVFEVTAFM